MAHQGHPTLGPKGLGLGPPYFIQSLDEKGYDLGELSEAEAIPREAGS